MVRLVLDDMGGVGSCSCGRGWSESRLIGFAAVKIAVAATSGAFEGSWVSGCGSW